MSTRNLAIAYLEDHKTSFLSQLCDLLKIPSVSTDLELKDEVVKAAEFLAQKLTSIGIKHVQVFPTAKHPIIYGDHLHAGPLQPTILIYGHYDVQPADPIDLWKNPPFSPTIEGDNLFARGASDMKGQVFACISAIESILKSGEFPVNIKFIFEGEEEIGSINLKPFLRQHKDLLESTVAFNPDTGMLGKSIPTIVYGLRGLSYFEIRVFGPDRDLHSGVYGGIVHNPAQVLCELIAKMHDEEGRVTLPGFYDHVKSLSTEERVELSRLDHDEEYYRNHIGINGLWGENGFSPVERLGARPTLEVNGFLSGFVGQGSKTIIPSKAMAKISTRLVPDQDPEEVHNQLTRFMEDNAPKTVRWEVEKISTGSPSISDLELNETKALIKALKTVWGVNPIFKREGGSVPVVADMQEILGIDSVLTGFGLPDDNIHSPNEKLDLPTWYKGIESLIHFFFNAKKE